MARREQVAGTLLTPNSVAHPQQPFGPWYEVLEVERLGASRGSDKLDNALQSGRLLPRPTDLHQQQDKGYRSLGSHSSLVVPMEFS
jgi:hypothetical protein